MASDCQPYRDFKKPQLPPSSSEPTNSKLVQLPPYTRTMESKLLLSIVVSPVQVDAIRYSPVPAIEYHAFSLSSATLPCTNTSGCKRIAAPHTVLVVVVCARAVRHMTSHSWIEAKTRARMVKSFVCLRDGGNELMPQTFCVRCDGLDRGDEEVTVQ